MRLALHWGKYVLGKAGSGNGRLVYVGEEVVAVPCPGLLDPFDAERRATLHDAERRATLHDAERRATLKAAERRATLHDAERRATLGIC